MKAKYKIDTQENIKFAETMRMGLLEFGKQFPSPGGGSYYLGDDGTPWMDRPRQTWITCRMLHVYSIGCFMGFPESGELADCACKGLLGELHDKRNGGWYSGLTADNQPLPDKQCYAHAFVLLAASSAVLAEREGSRELLNEAADTFDQCFWDEKEGLACDTWNTEFTKLDAYRGLNANMHTVEAFLAVADVTDDEKYRVRAGRIISRVLKWAEANQWRIPEHFTADWLPDLECSREKPADPFKPYGATPGHGIEWARLIVQWAASACRNDEGSRMKYLKAAENLFNRAIEDAWATDGAPGIAYTTDWNGEIIVHDRMHWTLAEAINTSAVLYRVTKDPKYARCYAELMQYLDEKVLDRVNGSWFHQLDRDNRPLSTVWPGKPDLYHAFQSTLIPYSRVDLSIASALYRSWLPDEKR